jgi:hypothetical protein
MYQAFCGFFFSLGTLMESAVYPCFPPKSPEITSKLVSKLVSKIFRQALSAFAAAAAI